MKLVPVRSGQVIQTCHVRLSRSIIRSNGFYILRSEFRTSERLQVHNQGGTTDKPQTKDDGELRRAQEKRLKKETKKRLKKILDPSKHTRSALDQRNQKNQTKRTVFTPDRLSFASMSPTYPLSPL